jgi:AcrR family transcriptional regulator
LTSVSLRQLADATGVSSRMLVHHFGSKNRLLTSALGEARRRQRAAFEDWLRARPGQPSPMVIADAWRWLSTERHSRTYALRRACRGTKRVDAAQVGQLCCVLNEKAVAMALQNVE